LEGKKFCNAPEAITRGESVRKEIFKSVAAIFLVRGKVNNPRGTSGYSHEGKTHSIKMCQ